MTGQGGQQHWGDPSGHFYLPPWPPRRPWRPWHMPWWSHRPGWWRHRWRRW